MRLVVLMAMFAACDGDTGTDTEPGTDVDSDTDSEAQPIEELASFDARMAIGASGPAAVTFIVGNAGGAPLCQGATTFAEIGDEVLIDEDGEGVYSYDATVDVDFTSVAACLTNGVDDSAVMAVRSGGGIGYVTGSEEYLGIGTPDLAGATVTDIDIEVTSIEVTTDGGLEYEVTTTTTIYGHPAAAE